ncbi:hypothetical protein Poly51_23890 [Rubripirellula tenax]|uniref:Spermatogenesis-associated protein 20-like TRX domain-containing protein n=1 Tax=Rubripirellula tenax TaxID=2528015 RepID=A0A5C6F555_9BACT|nr:thioredoxin domain-containing protein [Rubripirellula tenax]TWU56478.1 hypothetical protein Poly51_23890 [Rubripirellula tenax]
MNRLAESLSPYLLQHQTNPVDWFPWGDEAFELARSTDRPVFLSIGYAACHWCHVMERESFENTAIAKFLNDYFVCVKVDREERPDVDHVYMSAVQLMTGRGGWPMSVFLNHVRQPFYAGTYWPPTSRQGMPGFGQVLDAIAAAWNERRDEVNQHADQMNDAMIGLATGTSEVTSAIPDACLVDQAVDDLLDRFDDQEGGFGSAPKFPHATDLDLLLRRAAVSGDERLIHAAEWTLDKMACGGIHDHIGGGFARYSVDGRWLVPHFEKMLYDNALLAEVYVRAYQVTGNERHADVAKQTLDYLCREMVDDAGGFHCSEDADSEGIEGKYYVWTPDEVIQALGEVRGRRFCEVYDITSDGNFEGKSIAHLKFSVGNAELAAELAEDRERLRQVRDGRVHPSRDDKVITAWNSLAIKSLAIAGAVLNEPRYIEAAERSAKFVLSTMLQPNQRLLHAYRDGQPHLEGYVDDYAYTIAAFIALFEATGRARWIARATKLADTMLAHFEDSDRGGFYYSADVGEALIAKTKDWHDGSLISGNASAAHTLLQLSRLCDRDDFRLAAERTLTAGGEVLDKQAAACGGLISVLDLHHGQSEQWVLAVPDMQAMQLARTKFLKRFRPRATISWVVGESPESGPVVAINAGRGPIDGQTTLYRCMGHQCDPPLTNDALDRALQ